MTGHFRKLSPYNLESARGVIAMPELGNEEIFTNV